VRITVLGKSPSWPDAGGACSGYLVESGSTRLLLDCGPGVFGKLRAACDYAAVDAVVLSHMHADHFLDVIPYASALVYGPRWTQRPAPRPALHAPPGAREAFASVCAAAGMDAGHVEAAFAVQEYDPAQRIHIGELHVRFQPVPHYVPAQAVEVSDGARRFTFGADSGPSDDLCAFARDTDLLLIEASVTTPDDDGRRGHLTPAEAGDHGRRAAARRLVLTHISDELDLDAARAEAQEAFGGDVDIAAGGAVYSL
jgi:ribonuclease BN (tRNA processing enzyme)